VKRYHESLELKPNPRKSKRFGPVYIIAGPERSGTI
ncbi:unnamed protein product, partial [Adineta steineri]